MQGNVSAHYAPKSEQVCGIFFSVAPGGITCISLHLQWLTKRRFSIDEDFEWMDAYSAI